MAASPCGTSFHKLKVRGPELRSYFRENSAAQCQILFYRDKWWNPDGGTLYGELFCLVPRVQIALCGQHQSLAAPDYAVPFHHFQFGLQGGDPERSWPIHSTADLACCEPAITHWLGSKAVPWFQQLATEAGVLEYLLENKRFFDLALLSLASGRRDEARNHLYSWMALLPRQIDRPLAQLFAVGLLTAAEHTLLVRASMQRDDHYQSMINAWRSGA